VLVHDQIEKKKGTLFSKLYPRKDPNLMWVSVRVDDLVFKIAKLDPDSAEFTACVYDLAADPHEKNNMFDPNNGFHRRNIRELQAYRGKLISACIESYKRTTPELPEEERLRRLKALGYI
jgi:hypothetical protein